MNSCSFDWIRRVSLFGYLSIRRCSIFSRQFACCWILISRMLLATSLLEFISYSLSMLAENWMQFWLLNSENLLWIPSIWLETVLIFLASGSRAFVADSCLACSWQKSMIAWSWYSIFVCIFLLNFTSLVIYWIYLLCFITWLTNKKSLLSSKLLFNFSRFCCIIWFFSDSSLSRFFFSASSYSILPLSFLMSSFDSLSLLCSKLFCSVSVYISSENILFLSTSKLSRCWQSFNCC